MSASLVGSEMCIRDRLSTASPSCLCGASGGTGTPPSGVKPMCYMHAAQPVSYTHLTLPTICSV
eukprot:9302357-Alexandrium_andersonii.AAC.1